MSLAVLSNDISLPRRLRLVLALGLTWAITTGSVTHAQIPGRHPVFHAQSPPGLVGATRAAGPGPVAGYFQPVEIRGPAGTQVTFAEGGQFTAAYRLPVTVGLLVGRVYRLKVTNVPQAEGLELFPTIELVDRLYPPAGQELHFPIVLELPAEDLLLAGQGKFVTRVIYLEDPQRALPVMEQDSGPFWFDVRPNEDPLAVADSLGRPLAIIRLGGRVPLPEEENDPRFLFGSPPLRVFPPKVKLLPSPPPIQGESAATPSANREGLLR